MRTIIFLILFFLNTTASADVDNTALGQFKSYLTSLKSVAIDFSQTDNRGTSAKGTLIIVKPSRFACNYYAPYPLYIAGNKSYISVYDFDLGQLSRIKADDNMFNFLMTSMIDIENNFHINETTKTADEIVVELYSTETDRTTRVVVALQPTAHLKSIITNESDGNVIRLEIGKITPISNVNESLFGIKNPEVFGKPRRLDEKTLKGKYEISN